jgi:2-iminobutanoate/2-iminopropanoate deaminase
MRTLINPNHVSGNQNYSHGVLVNSPARILFIAGQVGRDVDGSIPEGIEAQAEIAMRNLADVLDASNMSMVDIVETTVYLLSREDNVGFDKVRTKWMLGLRPASTKLYISGLAHPRMLCEVQATAVCQA